MKVYFSTGQAERLPLLFRAERFDHGGRAHETDYGACWVDNPKQLEGATDFHYRSRFTIISCSIAFLVLVACALVYVGLVLARSMERAADPSRYVFLFGDSYSSTGYNLTQTPQPSVSNPFGNPEYPGVRTSGGDIWIDTVAQNLGHAVVYNLARGANMINATQAQAGSLAAGPPVVDLRDQEAEFETIAKNTSIRWTARNSVFISWFGINDVGVQMYKGRNYTTSTSILAPDVDQHFALLGRMHQLGARNFIVVLVPPIYRAPVFGYGSASNAPEVQHLTSWWNTQVQQGNTKFRSRYLGVKPLVVDPTPVFSNALDNPQAYGAPNSTCYNYPQGQPCLWADFIHPGIVVQREFGNRMTTAVRDGK